MTGDSENEFDSVGGETPTPPPAEPSAGGGGRTSSRKAFRNWSSAHEEEGVLDKIGKRISGIFSKKSTTPSETESESSGSDFELIMPEPIEAPAPETPVEMAAEPSVEMAAEPSIEMAAEPSIETADETAAPLSAEPPMVFDVVPDSEPILTADIVPDVEPEVAEPEVVEKPKRPSLIARLFGRKPKEEPRVESFELEKDETSELHATAAEEEPLIVAASEEEALIVEASDPQLQETLEPAFIEPEQTDHPTLPPPIEEPTTAPIPESVGLFGRLFSRKPKVSRPIPVEQPAELEPTVEEMPALEAADSPVESSEVAETEAPVAFLEEPVLEEPVLEEPVAEEATPFASVEEALPAEPEPSTVDLLEAALAEPIIEEEKKPGFFGRLFGRKSKPEPRPSLEIEFHEDRIEAAAHALDEVSGESFAGATADATDPYANVEDALPANETANETADETADATPEATRAEPALSAEDLRWAPPPVVQAPETPVVADSRSTLELEPFDPFAQTLDPSRDTVETTPVDSRSTLEVPQQEPRSTEEIALEAELRGEIDFSSTQEIEEKTDEFAIPSVDTEATTGELLETDTTRAAKMTWWMRLLGRKPQEAAPKAGAAAGATVVEGNPNFLFSKFKAFYGEIIRFQHKKTEFAAGFSTAILTDFNADLSPDAAAAAQSQALHQMLELQMAEAQWMGGEAKERYPDAQYAMAVMADELFTHMEWDGQQAWRNHLLEVKLYRSHAADVELFKRIDKLLKESPNSHVARDLARVYLLVLAAGFQGKYRPFGLPRALAQYRQRLYEYIHQGDSLMLYAPDRKIFPDAASRTLEGHAVGRFSSLQRWAAILIFMALGYTVLAHYAWNRVSADLKDVTERIRAASSTSGAATNPSTNSAAANGGAGR